MHSFNIRSVVLHANVSAREIDVTSFDGFDFRPVQHQSCLERVEDMIRGFGVFVSCICWHVVIMPDFAGFLKACRA